MATGSAMKLLTPAALTRTLLEWPRCALCRETPLVPSDALIDAKLPLRSLVADQVWRWLKNSCPTRLSCLWCARNTAADWAVPGCGHHQSGHHQMFQHTLGSDPGAQSRNWFSPTQKLPSAPDVVRQDCETIALHCQLQPIAGPQAKSWLNRASLPSFSLGERLSRASTTRFLQGISRARQTGGQTACITHSCQE